MRLKDIFFKKGLFRNFSILLISNLIVHLFNLLTNLFLARTLGTNDYGVYGIIITWAIIIQMISSFGIQQVVIRHIAKSPEKSFYLFKISLTTRIVGYLCTIILFILYSILYTEYSYVHIIFIISYALGLFLWDSIQNVAFGLQKMESTGYINAIGSILLLLLFISLPTSTANNYYFISILIIVQLLKDVFYYISCNHNNYFIKDINHKIHFKDCIYVIKESFPFYVICLFSLFTTQLPVLFLSVNTNNIEVAYFNTANKLMVPLTMILQTLMIAIFPKFVKDYTYNPNKFYNGANHLIRIILVVGAFFCFIISCFRNEIVILLYGEEYKNTGDVMLTQSWYVLYFSILSYYGTLLASIGKDKNLAILTIMNSLIFGIIIWYTSYLGSSVMSYGYVCGGIINLATNSLFLYKINNSIFSRKNLIIINLGLVVSIFISSIVIKDLTFVTRTILAIILTSFVSFYYFKIIKNTIYEINN